MTLRQTLTFLGCLALVACGPANQAAEEMMENQMEAETGQEADVDINADGSVRIEGEDGSMMMGSEMPEDWPNDVAIYSDARITWSAATNPDTGKPAKMVMFMVADSQTQVYDFYKKQLAADGWTTANTMQATGISILTATKDDRVVSLSVGGGEDTETTVTLAVEEAGAQ